MDPSMGSLKNHPISSLRCSFSLSAIPTRLDHDEGSSKVINGAGSAGSKCGDSRTVVSPLEWRSIALPT